MRDALHLPGLVVTAGALGDEDRGGDVNLPQGGGQQCLGTWPRKRQALGRGGTTHGDPNFLGRVTWNTSGCGRQRDTPQRS